MKAILIFCILVCLSGCASEPVIERGLDDIENSDADGAAFAGGGMFYAKPMKPNANKFDFFYKHCSVSTEGFSFVSKRAYSCTDAY